MINEALQFVEKELNNYFKAVFQITEDKTIVSNLVNADGSVPVSTNDKVVISLVSIEQETSIANLGFTQKTGNSYQVSNQPLSINLYVLFAANFNNYNESLKFISATINFFQANYVFLRKDYPAMGEQSERLVFELLKTDYQNAHYLWNALGAKYVPSMVYKMRMLTINEHNVRYKGALLTKPEVHVKAD